MKKIVLCPQCGGKGTIPIMNERKFDDTGIVEFLERTCLTCEGKKFIVVDTETLEKK